MSDAPTFFTCSSCGSHRLRVVLRYRTETTTQESMPCGCSADAVAATRRVTRADSWEEHFELDADHRWSSRLEEPENVKSLMNEVEIDVTCEKCYGAGKWSGEDDDITAEPVEVEGSREHWVRCYGCGREIPFAWSEKGLDGLGAGRIWPVECSDYDPARTWLDPRYQEAGKK